MNMNWRGVLPRIGAAVMAVGMTFSVAATANAASSTISSIHDAAELLTSSQEAELALGLESESQESGLVFAVDTVSSLKGQSLEEYAKERANELEIGDSEKDNGVLFVITREEREVHIQLADGVTGSVSDADAQSVVDEYMVPLLRIENYFDAVIAGADQVGYLYQSGANAMTPEEAAQNVEAGRVVDMWIYSIGGGVIGVALLALGIGGINSQRRYKQEEKAKERRRLIHASVKNLVGAPEEAAFMSLKDQEARTAFINDRLGFAIKNDKQLATEAPEAFHALYMKMKCEQVQKEVNYSAIDLAHSLSDVKLWSSKSIQTVLDEFRAKCVEGRATMDRITQAVVERGKQRLKEKAEKDKADRKAAKKVWSSLDRGAKKEIRAARTRREKQRIVSQYADPSVNVSLLFPVMYGLYASSMGDVPESRSSSSSSSSYGSSSSSSSSSSYSSSSSDYSSGSSFSDGGASGSY
jgi:uncharacterized membrane protein YgcG